MLKPRGQPSDALLFLCCTAATTNGVGTVAGLSQRGRVFVVMLMACRHLSSLRLTRARRAPLQHSTLHLPRLSPTSIVVVVNHIFSRLSPLAARPARCLVSLPQALGRQVHGIRGLPRIAFPQALSSLSAHTQTSTFGQIPSRPSAKNNVPPHIALTTLHERPCSIRHRQLRPRYVHRCAGRG
jgi:hypothetical protein